MRHRILLYIFLLSLFSIVAPHSVCAQKDNGQFVLVLDPGHGGEDPGAVGKKGTKEKDVNMSVSRAIGNLIAKKYPEIKIIYTRTEKKDVKVPLMQRAKIANDAKADLFISVHSNASKNRAAKGCQTFTLGSGSDAEAKAAAMYENQVILLEENFEQVYKGFDPRSSESYIIFELIRGHDMEKSISCAEHIQQNMVDKSGLINRGVSSAGFLVLHKTVMPSILVELGFISNLEEEKYLASKNGQAELATGIFEGFSDYYENYKKNKQSIKGEPETPKGDSKKKSGEKVADSPPKKQPEAKKSSSDIIFKVQILVSSTRIESGDSRLKGIKADHYSERGMYKYTYGESSDYEYISQLRAEIKPKFNEAFIVAFKNGEKIPTAQAIEEYRSKK